MTRSRVRHYFGWSSAIARPVWPTLLRRRMLTDRNGVQPCPSGRPASSDGTKWIVVAHKSAFPGSEPLPIRVAGYDLLLVRSGGEFRAIQRLCPHDFADLIHGEVHDGSIRCPRHAACFSLTDGSVSGEWIIGKLKTYPARTNGDEICLNVEEIQIRPPIQRRWSS